MIIADVREKCKSFIARIPRDLLTVGILVSASVSSFGLGYLTGLDERAERVPAPGIVPLAATAVAGQFVASKSGTKYYPPGCAGANRISEANKVWFASAAEAEEAGYALAANCK